METEIKSEAVPETKKEKSPEEIYNNRVKKMSDRQLLAELARVAATPRSNKLLLSAFAIVLKSQMNGYINGRRVYIG